MTKLLAKNIALTIDGVQILDHVDLELSANELVVILGSNGAGKSSLLKCALGLQEPNNGEITVGDHDINTLGPIERARQVSYLPQRRPMAWPILVKDVVALGRFAYGASLGRLSHEDQVAVDRAIEACDLDSLKDRRIDTLSGGETTRVHCARTFAAEAPLLFADEPTTALDPRHQMEIMMLLKSYVTETRGALVVAHEPALAARFADRLVWMKDGKIVANGSPIETLTDETLHLVYGVTANVSMNQDRPAIDFIEPTQ